MEINCPKCDYLNEDINEFLPDRACDDAALKCVNCEHEFLIGWTAEAEVRGQITRKDANNG